MSAAEALKAARAIGITVKVDGDDLVLEAPAPPPTAVLDALSRHKSGVVALLRRANDGWSAEDWQVFFDERAAIMEYDGEISREEAERQALDWCITTWLAANPPCGLDKGLCSACGEPIGRVGEDSIPLLAGKESHAWVHHTCVDEWRLQRRNLAVAALAKMGVLCKASEFEERRVTT